MFSFTITFNVHSTVNNFTIIKVFVLMIKDELNYYYYWGRGQYSPKAIKGAAWPPGP